jgi:hypothetical protein
MLSTHGERVRGRCKATNLCDYCAKLVAIENAEMLAVDAERTSAPEVWAVLTTRTATLDMEPFYVARRKAIKALRRRWEGVEYAALLEFTTGYGPRAGGERRPHWNLLLKGVARGDVGAVRAVLLDRWCDHVDALPRAQHVGVIEDMGGLTRYIALHFQKESQSPPDGFHGQRFNCSRGYFSDLTRREMREDARLSLQDRRERWKAKQLYGLEGDAADDWVDSLYADQGLPEWGIYSRTEGQP